MKNYFWDNPYFLIDIGKTKAEIKGLKTFAGAKAMNPFFNLREQNGALKSERRSRA